MLIIIFIAQIISLERAFHFYKAGEKVFSLMFFLAWLLLSLIFVDLF